MMFLGNVNFVLDDSDPCVLANEATVDPACAGEADGHVSSISGQVCSCSPGALVNVDLKDPCLNYCGNALVPEEPSPAQSVPPWTWLFPKLAQDAGVHSPCLFEKVEIEGVMIPPAEVSEVGVDFWKNYLRVFFLDSNLALRHNATKYGSLKGIKCLI